MHVRSAQTGGGRRRPATTSGAASLTVPRWGLSQGSGSTSALPCRACRLLPRPCDLGRVSASCLPSCGCATCGPWRGCAGQTLGEAESRATMEGTVLCWAGCSREREPGDSTSWPRRLRGARPWAGACCATPGGRLSPHLRGGGREPSHLVLWSSQAAHSCQGRSFLPETGRCLLRPSVIPSSGRLCQEAPHWCSRS